MTAIAQAETDDSFAVQQTAETISGTADNDTIYADNPDVAPSGTTVRIINFVAEMPSSTTTVEQVYVTGLPEGYSVLNAVERNGGYVVRLDPENTSDVRVVLQYTLPADGAETDFHGFYSNFVFNMEYTLDDGQGNLSSALGVARFAIRDVDDVKDTEFEDPITGERYFILNANPPGNTIDGGAGDDIIVAGAGDDVLDGGSGNDTVSYEMSSQGVTADLANVATAGSYADNDVLSGIENLIGSSHDDRLLGDGDDNILEGGAGADIIRGNGGNDTASYSRSVAGVAVDLQQAVQSNGDALGDTLSGIANLVGSANADSLGGDAAVNTAGWRRGQ
ncbi:MAG: hypothetical protein HC779_03265 [Phyllobacteriaceae bacterium]|nr:hypothetical protein [Phyllobacteriaceae bacterium]